MPTIKLNEQFAFLRKQKGRTQEELAQALGVTNQSVSKWESGVCCPDIQLLPAIAAYFGVSVDELMGYRPAEAFSNVYLRIKSLFEVSPKEEAFSIAFRLAVLLHEGACTRGYKEYVPWDTNKNYELTDDRDAWGFSARSEPEGTTVRRGNAVFITDNKLTRPVTSAEIRDIHSALEAFCDGKALKVLFGLYELTVDDSDCYVPTEAIEEKCGLSEETVRSALDHLPVQMKETDDGQMLYRIEGRYRHLPPMLFMLSYR